MKGMVPVLLVLVSVLHSPASVHSLRHYAGALPEGRDVLQFLDICSECGRWYGGGMERLCIMDKSFNTYLGCDQAINGMRRRK